MMDRNFNLFLTFALLLSTNSQALSQGLSNTQQNIKPTLNYGENALALEAIFSMGIRLQALLFESGNDAKNFLISPLSTTLIIAELMTGAEGPLLQELYGLLSLPKPEQQRKLIRYGPNGNVTLDLPYSQLHLQLTHILTSLTSTSNPNRKFTLSSLNALFYDHDLTLRTDFQEKMELYQAQNFALNFFGDPVKSTQYMNNYIRESTRGLINQFFTEALPQTTQAVFTNVLYFKADWETPFSYQLNTDGAFRTDSNRSVNTTFMQGQIDDLLYAESNQLQCKMIALPYKNRELQMYIVLPTDQDYSLANFVKRVKAREMSSLMSSLSKHDVVIAMPKFSVSSTLHLLEPLRKYSAYKKTENYAVRTSPDHVLDTLEDRIDRFSKFDGTANNDIVLTKAANKLLRVSDIVQKVKVTVDEKGTEAVAVTAAIVDYIGGTKSFVMDRPFTFFIRHEDTGTVLFWGTIVNPNRSN